MGNTQGSSKRDRHESGGFRKGNYPDDDHRPFELRIPNSTLSPSSSNLSMQYVNTSEYPVVIKWNSAPARTVCVSGSWDSWRTRIPMVKSKEDFTTIINLPEGRHEFKFLVDSQWQCDDRLPKTTSISGIDNNFIEVNHDDFDVSDALDKDLQATLASGATKPDGGSTSYPSNQTSHDSSTPTSSPLDLIKFGQEVPDRPAFSTAPPSLPPHLLQVILNKDTPLSCDPNVLPEPNHVMLNHLYALSIKDGVMVLSATHRYRKKYVTTLLYKPIG